MTTSTPSEDDTVLLDPQPYRRLVGKLVCLTCTWANITYAINFLSQHIVKSSQQHIKAVHCILRYLKTSPSLGLHYNLRFFDELHWCILRFGLRELPYYTTIHFWVCHFPQDIASFLEIKKQHTISRSSAEAKHRALITTSCEVMWPMMFL